MPAKKKTSTKTGNGRGAATKLKRRQAPKPDLKADFEATFSGLRKVMSAFADEFCVTADQPRRYCLVTKSNSWRGGPMFFGAVMTGKAYVSYHLMALYMHPELVAGLSPELKKRMQGKSCFNFHKADLELFKELSVVTGRGLEKYREKNRL